MNDLLDIPLHVYHPCPYYLTQLIPLHLQIPHHNITMQQVSLVEGLHFKVLWRVALYHLLPLPLNLHMQLVLDLLRVQFHRSLTTREYLLDRVGELSDLPLHFPLLNNITLFISNKLIPPYLLLFIKIIASENTLPSPLPWDYYFN